MATKLLEFRWTVSRGRDTYGYNICSLYVDGVKVSSCNGGGYDMLGTSLAQWLKATYEPQLRALIASGEEYYGLNTYGTDKVYLDGACGWRSMEAVARAIGLTPQYVPQSPRVKNSTRYLLTGSP